MKTLKVFDFAVLAGGLALGAILPAAASNRYSFDTDALDANSVRVEIDLAATRSLQ